MKYWHHLVPIFLIILFFQLGNSWAAILIIWGLQHTVSSNTSVFVDHFRILGFQKKNWFGSTGLLAKCRPIQPPAQQWENNSRVNNYTIAYVLQYYLNITPQVKILFQNIFQFFFQFCICKNSVYSNNATVVWRTNNFPPILNLLSEKAQFLS